MSSLFVIAHGMECCLSTIGPKKVYPDGPPDDVPSLAPFPPAGADSVLAGSSGGAAGDGATGAGVGGVGRSAGGSTMVSDGPGVGAGDAPDGGGGV